MTDDTPDLPEGRRRAVFDALVAARDGGAAVAASRETVAARYGPTVEAVKVIGREGLDSNGLV